MPALMLPPAQADPHRHADPAPRWEDQPDETLLAGYRRSDPEAASAFVARFGRRVYGLAYTMLGEARAAEDVAQEALLRAWRRADLFDVRRGSVSAWLLTITRNLAVDATRVRRPITVSPDELAYASAPSSDRGPADVAVLHDDIDALRDALRRLSDGQRRAVVLAGVWGMSAREIAERDGIPLGTAKTRIRSGLLRLRRLLSDDLLDADDDDGAEGDDGTTMAGIVRDTSLLP
jgi:RNA polymerase sigma factor (sigma-70 family)